MGSTTFLNALTLPATASVGDPTSLYAALQRISDPRKHRGRRYSLALVLTLIVLGKLAGETTLSGIAQWARLRTAWLTEVFALPHPQLPCANPYTWLSNKVAVDELNTVLAEFFVPPLPPLPAAPPAPQAALPRGQRHLALAGKTLRGTRCQGPMPRAAVHLLERYDVTHRGMLAQIEVATKEHEVPCAAQLIAGCDLAGCVVTADALHTQRDWCAQVMAQRGDYSLIAKENQPGLREDIAFLFAGTWPSWLEQRTVMTVNKGHGRIEVRRLRASTELQDLLQDRWTGLAQVFQLERERIRHGTCTHEVVYGISSLPAAEAGPERLLNLVRAHWQLENRVHWRKDVTLGEAASHVRTGHAPQVLAALNSAVLALMDTRNVRNLPAQM